MCAGAARQDANPVCQPFKDGMARRALFPGPAAAQRLVKFAGRHFVDQLRAGGLAGGIAGDAGLGGGLGVNIGAGGVDLIHRRRGRAICRAFDKAQIAIGLFAHDTAVLAASTATLSPARSIASAGPASASSSATVEAVLFFAKMLMSCFLHRS